MVQREGRLQGRRIKDVDAQMKPGRNDPPLVLGQSQQIELGI